MPQSLACSVYRKLLKSAGKIDKSAFKRMMVLDVVQDGGNYAAKAVVEGESLVGCVRKEFKKVEPVPLAEGFRVLSYLTAANDLGNVLREEEVVGAAELPPLDWEQITNTQSLPDTFVLVTHPLAYWNDSLLHQSVTLVIKESKTEYFGVILSNYINTVGETFNSKDTPSSISFVLNECEVRAGGYRHDERLAFVAMHKRADVHGAVPVKDLGVYLGGDIDEIEGLVLLDEMQPVDVRFHLGHLTWTTAALTEMLQTGHAIAMTAPDPFLLIPSSHHTDRLHKRYVEWQNAAARLPPTHSHWARFPPPSTSEDHVLPYLDKLSHIAV